MDATDFRIYAELFPDRRFTMRGLDPRISAESIGDRVGISRTAVRERLTAWEREGFLTSYNVLPNVGLFGARLTGLNVYVEDPGAKQDVVTAIGGMDAAFGSLDYVGPWFAHIIAVTRGHEDEEAAAAAKEIAALPGVDDVEPYEMFHAPECGIDLTPLDWRIVRALRAGPRRTLTEVAAAVGVSTRTVRRRYQRLLDEDAVWFVPAMDFRRLAGALVRVNLWLEPGADRAAVVNALRKAHPHAVETVGAPGVGDYPVLAWLHAASAAAVEEVRRDLSRIGGVDEVELLYPVCTTFWPRWVDARLADAGR